MNVLPLPPIANNPGGFASASTIQSVERAAVILELFTVSRPRLTLSEITARLGVSKATAHRYVMALRSTNLLRYDEAAGAYTLGPQILTLAAAAREGLPIVSVAGPFMEELVREVNETVVLSIWDGEAPIVVRVDDNTERVVRVGIRAGSRLAPTTSAQGRVFCAHLYDHDPVRQRAWRAGLPHLLDDLDAVRSTGIAVNSSDQHGVRTIATAVFQDGHIVAVLGVVGTMTSVPDDPTSPVAKALIATAARLSAELGPPPR